MMLRFFAITHDLRSHITDLEVFVIRVAVIKEKTFARQILFDFLELSVKWMIYDFEICTKWHTSSEFLFQLCSTFAVGNLLPVAACGVLKVILDGHSSFLS